MLVDPHRHTRYGVSLRFVIQLFVSGRVQLCSAFSEYLFTICHCQCGTLSSQQTWAVTGNIWHFCWEGYDSGAFWSLTLVYGQHRALWKEMRYETARTRRERSNAGREAEQRCLEWISPGINHYHSTLRLQPYGRERTRRRGEKKIKEIIWTRDIGGDKKLFDRYKHVEGWNETFISQKNKCVCSSSSSPSLASSSSFSSSLSVQV